MNRIPRIITPVPYTSIDKYQSDLMNLVDILLTRLLLDEQSTKPFSRHFGLPITPELIQPILTTEKPQDDGISTLLWQSKLLKYNRKIDTQAAITSDRSITPYHHIASSFELTNFGRLALLLALCPYFDRKYEKIFDVMGDYKGVGAPSLGSVAAIYHLMYGADNTQELAKFFIEDDKFSLLFDLQDGFCGLASPLIPNKNIIGEAMGYVTIDNKIVNSCCYHLPDNMQKATQLEPPLYGNDVIENVVNLTQKILKDQEFHRPRGILLQGKSGSGRMFSILHSTTKLSLTVLEIDVNKFIDTGNLNERLLCLKREYILRHPVICLRNCNYNTTDIKRVAIEHVIDFVSDFSPLLFITATADSAIANYTAKLLISTVEIVDPSYNNTAMILQKAFTNYTIADDVDEEFFAARFILTPGDVKRVLEYSQLIALSDGDNVIKSQHILSGISKLRKRELGTLGDFITCHYTFDDIVTTPINIDIMKQAVNHLKYRNVIMDKWGLRKKSRYGNNITVLFYGSPGTGKTMAAQVIANELGMELFRVDSSQLTSKYIGETAKNIRAVFDGAKGSNLILFFDEADSIFAKRTNQSNDANDRYANSDTSFLLQKIEDYDGMVLLSTNLLQNIDEAFRRRITYMVNFARPDQRLRKELWLQLITEEMPHDDIDYDFLSSFELVGSDIKSILISACYMAVAEGCDVSMLHMIKSLGRYMQKKGTPLIAEDLKQYRELFNLIV